MSSPVRFLRVVGIRAHSPQVLAAAGTAWVEWNPARGWTCTCEAPDGATCDHVEDVAALLDPRVLHARKARRKKPQKPQKKEGPPR